ncbi:hypothetical protein A3738_03095 [Oleiphilus sp. HI0066]|nr:hypothetical protein A3738_03095 [Oleiphilus sp. HI0066]
MYKLMFLSIALFLHGCAMTGLTRSESVTTSLTQNTSILESMNLSVEVGCNGNSAKTYSFMVSPLIPLPPIIPSFLSGPTNLFVTFPPNIEQARAYLSNSNGESQQIDFIERRKEWNGDGSVLFYRVKESCGSLDGSILRVEFIDSETGEEHDHHLRLKYDASDLKFEWGYLSA